jgi:hypothetical protein
MMMTMFPWIQIFVGGLFALLKLDRYLAFGKTLATVVKVTDNHFMEKKRTPLVAGTLGGGMHPNIVSGFQAAGFNVQETSANLNVQT